MPHRIGESGFFDRVSFCRVLPQCTEYRAPDHEEQHNEEDDHSEKPEKQVEPEIRLSDHAAILQTVALASGSSSGEAPINVTIVNKTGVKLDEFIELHIQCNNRKNKSVVMAGRQGGTY